MTNFEEATREALEFLRNHNGAGTLATVDADGQPYASSIYFVMGKKFDLFFLTTKDTNKARNIEVNNKVAFSVGSGPEYISIMIRGTATIPHSEEETQILPRINERLQRDKGFNWPIHTLDDLRGQNLVLYKITPKDITFLNINSTQEPKSNTNHLYHLTN